MTIKTNKRNCTPNNDEQKEWTKSYAQQRWTKQTNDIHLIDSKKRNESIVASCYMVVTVAPASAMQIMMNRSNQFIVKLSNEQKTRIRDTRTSRKPTTHLSLARIHHLRLRTWCSYVALTDQRFFKESHRTSGFPAKSLMINSCHELIKHLKN